MKQGDVLVLMDGIAPAIAALLGKALAPIIARLEATEKALADALAELAARPDVAAEVAKAMADQPKPEQVDVAAIERGIDERCAALAKRIDDMPEAAAKADLASLHDVCDEVRELVMGLPGSDGLVALVEKTVAAVPSLDPASVKRMVDESVVANMPAPREVDRDELAGIVSAEVEKATAPLPQQIEEAVKAAAEALPKAPTAEEVASLIPPPEPGKSVTIDDVRPLVDETVAAAVAALPPAEPGKSVTVDDVQPIVESLVAGAFATMPVPQNGAGANPDMTRAMVVEEVEKALTARPSVPTASEVAAFMPKPEDGKSVSLDDVRSYLDDAVAGVFATMRVPKDGKDADPETTKAMVDAAVKALPPAEPGKAPTEEEVVAAVEKVLETWERPKDGASVTVEQLLPAIESAVDKAVAARPVPKDGEQGRGIAGLLKDHEGFLVATYSDGATEKIARVDGDNGKDGLGFEDLDVVDGPTSVTLRFSRGDRVKEWTFPKASLADFFKFGWKDGEEYARGSVVMWGGQPWLAMADTKAKPETNSDWTMLAKKARDGRDGEAPKPPPIVKLK